MTEYVYIRIDNKHVRSGKHVRVKCWPTTTPGLVINRGLRYDLTPGKRWFVTHARSGYNIPYGDALDTFWQAAEFARRIADCLDWTMSVDDMGKLCRATREILLGELALERDRVGDMFPHPKYLEKGDPKPTELKR